MSGSTSETIGRFVYTMTGHKVAGKKILEVRNGKIEKALAAVKYQIDRLEASGVRNSALDHKYADLLAAHAVARSRPDEAERYDALETVKQNARAAMAEATEIVGRSLADLPAFLAMQQNARRALVAAESAINQIGVPEFRQGLEVKLGFWQGQFNASSRKDGEFLKEDTEQLRRCALNAGLLAKEVNRCAEKLAERTNLLARVDAALADLQTLVNKSGQALPGLTQLTQERNKLANAGPAKLLEELEKGPSLLARCQTAIDDLNDWAVVERTNLLAGIDTSIADLQTLVNTNAQASSANKATERLTQLTKERNQLANAGSANLWDELKKGPSLLARCQTAVAEFAAEAKKKAQEQAERTELLAEVDKSLSEMFLYRFKEDADELLRGLEKERYQLANGGPGVEDELKKLLARCRTTLDSFVAQDKSVKAAVQATQATGWDQAIPDPQHLTAAHKTATQGNEWDKTKELRDKMRKDADAYVTFGKKENQAALVQYSEQLKADLEILEKGSIDDPNKAADLLQRKLVADYENLKENFSKISQQLQKVGHLLSTDIKGVLQKVEDLIRDNPDCVEAQMQKALGTDLLGRDVFKQRLQAVHDNAKRWNAPQFNLLTLGEAVAIYSYTADDFSQMNAYLNGLDPEKYPPKFPSRPATVDEIKIKNKCATEALKKLPPYPKSVTIRISDQYEGDEKEFALNNEFTIKAFWSTNISNPRGFKGKWKILVRGETGRHVQPLAKYSDSENEVLYAPGTKFKVIERDDTDPNDIKITVQEV
jgi:hypothetical protein